MASEGHWVEDLEPVRKEPGEWFVFKGYGSVAASLRTGRFQRPDREVAGTNKDPWEFVDRSGDLWVMFGREA